MALAGLWTTVNCCLRSMGPDGGLSVAVDDGFAHSLLSMGNHRDLQVWQRACQFAGQVDRETRQLGRGHGELGDQLRRAALSIPTNLAEGSSRGRDPEFLRFINIAVGSAAECNSLLAHAELVVALDPDIGRELVEELTVIRKMLFRLRIAVQTPATVVAAERDPQEK